MKRQPDFSTVKIPYRTIDRLNTASTQCRIMQWHIIPAKWTDDAIIATSTFVGNQLSDIKSKLF